MSNLIAFTGYAGCGKSTAAKHLVDAHGYTLVKFAGPLKAMMRALGLGDREIEGDLKEIPCKLLDGRTPRYAMQTLGTEWGRDLIGPHFWVNVATDIICAVLDQGGKVVIDDLRFDNEAIATRVLGGRIVKVARPGVGAVNSHSSDNVEIKWMDMIINDGPVEQLRASVDLLVEG